MKPNLELFGVVTVAERGQVVIPAEARERLSINSGDKLLAFHGPHDSVLLVKPDQFEQQFSDMIDHLQTIRQKISNTDNQR